MSYAALIKKGSIVPMTDMIAGMFIFNAGLHAYLHAYCAGVDYVLPWQSRPVKVEAKH